MPRQHRGPEYQRLLHEEEVILDITETLCERMTATGMTREEVATAAGIHPTALAAELAGHARIPLRDLIRIAAVLGVRPKLTPVPGHRQPS